MHPIARRPDRLSFVAIVMVAILSATVLFAVASLSSPSIALGASVYAASCDDVALRTRPSTVSRRMAVIDSGKQVSVVSTGTGGSWTVTCAGKTTSGNTWYRINAVMGQKVSARYGVTYLYVATGLLSPVNPASRYSACKSVGLRTRPSSSATRKAVIPLGTKVTVVAKVTGGSYTRSCGSRSVSGRTWYKISMVGSRTAKSRYGVKYVYALVGLFSSTKPSPTTPPPPPPTSNPTPPPNGLAVPSSINKTGTADASAALNAWIATVPDGSTIVFPAGGIYRLDHGIKLTNRHHLTFIGNGATLRANGSGGTHTDTPFALWGGDTYITIKGFNIVGNNPTGLYTGTGGSENLMGVTIFGAQHVEVANNTIRNTWGDGVYVTNSESGGGVYPPSEDISIHDNHFSYIGRMGIAIISAKRVQIERNSFDRMSLDVLDIEPDWPAPRNSVRDILFKDNTIGTYAHSDLYRSHVLSICGSADAPVTNVTVDNNVVTGGRQVNARNSAGGVTARSDRPNRTNIRFTNNRSTTPGPGYMLVFENVTTLTATGNVQPLTSGQFAYIVNSTGVTYP